MKAFVAKVRKNGFLRLTKTISKQLGARIRGLIFGVINTKPAFPQNLIVYAGVESLVKCLVVGADISISRNCSFGGAGTIVLSSGVVLNRNVHMDSTNKISIGENTLVGPDCYFVDSNHVLSNSEILVSANSVSAPIEIGANVWIGRGVTVLAGVVIGNNSVIGAGAVVTKSIPAGVVVAGVPARIIKAIGE